MNPSFFEIRSKDLFSSKRIFILTNFTKIKDIDFFIKNTFDDVIIIESDKYTKTLKALEGNSLYIDCTIKPWEKEKYAVSSIKSFITKQDFSIDEETAICLYQNIGFDLYKIFSEIKKIFLFKETKSQITKQDIYSVCILNKSYNIFDIVDKIIENKKKEALEIMEKVFLYETSPSILLISLWYSHFENMLYIKNTNKSEDQLNSYIKMPPSVIKKKLTPQANRLSNEKIIKSLNFLAELDVNLRKGSFDLKFYLEKFILDF